MCSENVILDIQNISKCFEVYHKPVHRLFQTLWHGRKKFYQEFWALHDISFQIHRGECVGIIGKNGAGKSTLLQIIMGILTPTSGKILTNGKIAALLELGSGFNPEFTGRENVYLNASILGMSKEQIDSKYQEIIDFADIGDFVDQPVKTYSSGMMVRLAFAVQIMIEPEILIVDEALAVGDAAFQRKCYARMDQMVQRGMTLLLVTHDTEIVKQRCNRVLFLKNGRVAFDGDAECGVITYLRYLFPQQPAEHPEQEPQSKVVTADPQSKEMDKSEFIYEKKNLIDDPNCWGVGGGNVAAIRIYGLQSPNLLLTPNRIRIEIEASWNVGLVEKLIEKESLPSNIMVGIRLSDVKSNVLYGTNNSLENVPISPAKGRVTISYTLDLITLKNGDLFLSVAISAGNMGAHVHMVWDDLSIHLKSVSKSQSDGFVHFKTHTAIEA